MNKKTLRIAGWALGLSMAVAGIGVAVGANVKAPLETKADGITIGDRVTSNNFVEGKTVVFATADKSAYVDSITTGSNGWLKVNGGDAMLFTLGGAATAASLETSAGKYIGFTGTKNVSLNNSSTTPFYITAAGVVCIGSSSNELQYNSSSKGFRVYSNNSYKKSALFYANYIYTVTYDANGGSCGTSSEEVLENGHPSLPVPTHDGYSFDGWQVNGSGDYVTSNYEVKSNVTLVAHWTPLGETVTVTYNANGGTCATSSETILKDGHPTLPTPVWEHHTFDGWQINGEGDYVTSNYEVSANVTLVAHWTENAKYSVTYIASLNGSGSNSSVEYSGSYMLLPIANVGISADSGYKFKHYSVAIGATDPVAKQPGETITIDGVTVITAVFEIAPMEFVIEFTGSTTTNMNGNNEANSLFGLDDEKWSVKGIKNTPSNNVGLNATNTPKTIRLYADKSNGDGNTLEIESLDSAVNVSYVTLTIAASSKGNFEVDKVVSGSSTKVSETDGKYNINAPKLTIQNITTGSSDQVHFENISVAYDYVESFKMAQTFEANYVKKNVSYADATKGTNCLTWYDEAVTAYNDNEIMNSEARVWFASRDEFANARARLIAWAEANRKVISFNAETGAINTSSAYSGVQRIETSSELSSLPLLITVAAIGVATAGGYFFVNHRRREE